MAVLSVALLLSAAVSGPASADPADNLTTAVEALRNASKCPPLQSDPLVMRAAQMSNQATSDFIAHRSPAVPFTDPMPALKAIGFTGSAALLSAGYGEKENDSIQGLVLELRANRKIADCSYTQYGANAMQDNGFVLTSVVLAVQ